LKERLAVALDTADRDELERWCRFFGPRVGVLKIGLEAFARLGPVAVEIARSAASRVFLDLKLHDIPNTVAGAVRAARDLGVDLLTVHASGGLLMLEAAVEAARGDVKLLGVTLLTHLDESELERLDLPGAPAERVERWAELAARGGCAGVVSSPQEAARLRARHAPPFLLVTPGVRPAGTAGSDDQRRVATASQALSDGADLLVVGRPLTRASDPAAALDALLREMAGVAG
jgi:orotidine-5'-phosphate decarboxylase